mgnify:CR=1 FL=1
MYANAVAGWFGGTAYKGPSQYQRDDNTAADPVAVSISNSKNIERRKYLLVYVGLICYSIH